MAEEAAWIKQQRKAFMGWCNGHLADRQLNLNTFEEDFQDGVMLWNLIEIISGKPVKFESKKPKSKIQKVSNLGHVFKFLEGEKLKLVNIGPEDIYNANSKLILGFIWTLILRYQIQKATWGSDVGSASKAKQDLLEWVNAALKASGSSLVAKDFKHSFSDGQIFVALVNYLAPGSVSASGDPITDMNNAFNAAQTFLNIPSLLEAELVNHDPDDLSIMTYVSYFRAKRPDVTAASEPGSAKDANEHQVPARVVAEGPGLGSAADWDESEPLGFTIFAEDDQGRRIPLYTIDVSIEGPKDAPHQVTKNDQDLSAHVTYNPQEVGDYKVSVKVNEKEAEGNPFSVHVREAVDQNKVKASGRGTKKAVVGKKAKVAVKVYNKKGKRLDVDEQRIHVAVGDDEAKLEHQLKRSSKGKYKVSYKPEKAGQLSLDVNLDSKSVRGSPFTVTVKDNEDDLAAADQCTLLGPLGHAQINVPKSFKIKAKNNEGGKVVGEEFDVEITGPNGEPVDDVTVTDNEDGTYTVTFTPTALGDHKVEIELDDDQVKGSPFVTVVTENPVTDGVPNGAKSRAYGPGIESPEEGAVTQFTVEPRDENDNVVPSGVDVDVKINGPNGEIPVTVTENDDGTHTVSYTPEQAGEIQVAVSVNGQPLAYSPFPIEVRDSVDRSKTKAQGRGLKKASVGKDAKFYLKTYNKKGKRTDVEMGNFEVKVTGNDEELENQGSQVGKGKYLCSYVPTQVGNVNVVINYENQPVKNSPFSVKVSENSDDFADASRTLASGPGLVAAQVNVPATFKIFAKTSNGQKAVGEEFDVEVVGPNGEPIDDVTVTDNEDGSYTVQYTPTEVGDNIVSVTLNCDDVKGSPATVKVSEDAVSASGPDAAQSKAYGPGLKHPYAGVPTQFTVEPKDENGNNVPYPVDVDVQVTGPDGQVVSSQVSEPSDDGKVEVAYNPEQVGDHKVAVAVNGEPIAKSPVTVAVRPAFDAKNSSASGPGLEKPVEDKPTQFQVKLADANGNPLANGGYTVAPRFDGPDHPEAQVTDNQDGTFDVVYTPVKPGHYKVDVLVDDQPIGSSPYPVEVLCSADPAQCTASGPGLEKATQYEPAHFTIQAKDKSGNNMNVGGNDFTIEVKGDNDSVNADIKDNNDGTYTVSYTPESDGDHKVSVVLDEKPIAGSPFSVPVAGPVADATNSSAKGDGLKKAFTTKSNKFEVSIKDKKGKPVQDDSSNVEVTVDGPEGSIEASLEKKKKGKHQVKYQPSQAGDLTINVNVNGEPVKNSPFAVKCVEGPDRSKLKVAGKGLSTAFTTRSANFNVDAQDKNGEPINDPELFEVSIAPLNEDGSVGAAPEKENPYNISIEHGKKGNHEVSYQLDKVGKYQLNVTHGDDHLAESPYTVVCKNGSRPEKSVVSKWSFTITAKTEEGEIVDDDEDNFEVNIEGPVELTAKVKALGKGKYRVTYSPSAEGQYKIHITLAGSPIKGSPFIQSF